MAAKVVKSRNEIGRNSRIRDRIRFHRRLVSKIKKTIIFTFEAVMKLEYKNDDLTFNNQRQENGKYDKINS